MISLDRRQRDLEWCLHSPPLVTARGSDTPWPRPEWFATLEMDVDPKRLPEPRHAHYFRLGQHFEATLATWLAASADFKLLAANLQVRDHKRTVGEFDFLVEHAAEVEHWEVAVKFYLGTGDGRTLACWYGPNTSDRFDRKYQRLIDHQLTLATNPYAEATLAERNLTVARNRCFMKRRLFHPWQRYLHHDFQAPEVINPGHEKGWWLSRTDFLSAFGNRGHRFVYLPKVLWLSPLSPVDYEAPLSCWELAEFLEAPHAEQATHVAVVTEDGEVSRGFIVNNQWFDKIS